jgi:hypothetical protein
VKSSVDIYIYIYTLGGSYAMAPITRWRFMAGAKTNTDRASTRWDSSARWVLEGPTMQSTTSGTDEL